MGWVDGLVFTDGLGSGGDDGPAQVPGAITQRQQGFDDPENLEYSPVLVCDQGFIRHGPGRAFRGNPQDLIHNAKGFHFVHDFLDGVMGLDIQYPGVGIKRLDGVPIGFRPANNGHRFGGMSMLHRRFFFIRNPIPYRG